MIKKQHLGEGNALYIIKSLGWEGCKDLEVFIIKISYHK